MRLYAEIFSSGDQHRAQAGELPGHPRRARAQITRPRSTAPLRVAHSSASTAAGTLLGIVISILIAVVALSLPGESRLAGVVLRDRRRMDDGSRSCCWASSRTACSASCSRRRRSPGQAVMDHIRGFRKYLEVAEGEDLKRIKGPPLTPQLFEAYLPAALALGVEQAWAERFADVFRMQAGLPARLVRRQRLERRQPRRHSRRTSAPRSAARSRRHPPRPARARAVAGADRPAAVVVAAGAAAGERDDCHAARVSTGARTTSKREIDEINRQAWRGFGPAVRVFPLRRPRPRPGPKLKDEMRQPWQRDDTSFIRGWKIAGAFKCDLARDCLDIPGGEAAAQPDSSPRSAPTAAPRMARGPHAWDDSVGFAAAEGERDGAVAYAATTVERAPRPARRSCRSAASMASACG